MRPEGRSGDQIDHQQHGPDGAEQLGMADYAFPQIARNTSSTELAGADAQPAD